MIDNNAKIIGLIDNAIYLFSILFLCTVTNTIFLNQFGYFIPLLLILFRYYLTKENPFKKTGLEWAFLIYIAVEILSTIFSISPLDSLDSLRKRFLLIPTVYTFLFAANDFERTKKFVIIYLGAAVTTMLIYIGLSYNYYINSLYQLYESGPATFQYPITTSELMSFSLILIFAFLIHEKLNWKMKLLLLLCFFVNLIALLATYKRTGWMGAAAGLLFVIILSRKWLILTPVIILIIAASFIEKNVSKIFVYEISNNKVIKKTEIESQGRANNVLPSQDDFYVSDHDKGLVYYNNLTPTNKINTESPVTSFKKWKDEYYIANLLDTRFIQYKKDSNNKLEAGVKFLSPGFTEDWCIANNYLYVVDSDSGVTIFKNPTDSKDKYRFFPNDGNEYTKIFADSSILVLFSKSSQLTIYSLSNALPEKLLLTKLIPERSQLVFYEKGNFIFSEPDGIKLFSIAENKIKPLDFNKEHKNIYLIEKHNEKLIAVTTKGNLLEMNISDNKLDIKPLINLGYVPTSLSIEGNKLYTTLVKRSRLLSAVDPYNPSNLTRLALWRAGWNIFKDHPLLGVGDIDLAQLYRKYKRDFDKEIQGHMHNDYVHILVTLGIFGIFSVMLLFIKIFQVHIQNFTLLRKESFSGAFALGAAGMFVSFLVSGLTEWNFGDHEIITVIWFTLGFSIALKYFHQQRRAIENQ